jgi:hypothetical protein
MVDAVGKLSLYNGALRLLGERKLASLTEAREPRRILDSIWDGGAVNFCLEQGQWNFAIRTYELDYNSAIAPTFGYIRGFTVPSDSIRTVGVCSDPYFRVPLLQYTEEAGIIYCDLDKIYLRFVSNDTSYGNDYSLWPETFKRYVESYMALEACESITGSAGKYDKLFSITRKRLTDAKAKDAMKDPTAFPPMGTWAKSRIGRHSRGLGSYSRETW